MSGTSAWLVVKTSDTEYKCAWVAYDGYPSGVGKTLIEHYNSLVRANELVSGGSMVAVRPTLDVYDDSLPYDKCSTEYYVRDCGARKEDCGVKIGKTIAEAIKATKIEYADYVYLWKDDRWWFANGEVDFLANLADALSKVKTI